MELLVLTTKAEQVESSITERLRDRTLDSDRLDGRPSLELLCGRGQGVFSLCVMFLH